MRLQWTGVDVVRAVFATLDGRGVWAGGRCALHCTCLLSGPLGAAAGDVPRGTAAWDVPRGTCRGGRAAGDGRGGRVAGDVPRGTCKTGMTPNEGRLFSKEKKIVCLI